MKKSKPKHGPNPRTSKSIQIKKLPSSLALKPRTLSKQRTNWKQRALLAELRLDVCNQAADVTKKFSDLIVEQRDKFEARALSAEKHNALLLEEREAKVICSICGGLCNTKLKHESFCSVECITAFGENEQKKRPTHWQRFKSWLGVWRVAVLCVLFMLSGVAAFVAFVWKQGG